MLSKIRSLLLAHVPLINTGGQRLRTSLSSLLRTSQGFCLYLKNTKSNLIFYSGPPTLSFWAIPWSVQELSVQRSEHSVQRSVLECLGYQESNSGLSHTEYDSSLLPITLVMK